MTTSELYAADVDRLVQVLDDARQDAPGPGLPWALLEGLQQLVPCDLDVSYQHHEYAAARSLVMHAVESGGARVGPLGPSRQDPDDPFWAYWWEGLCSWPQRTGDLRSVIHTGDFFPTERDRLADRLVEVNPHVRAAMIVSLPAAPGQCRRVVFMRATGPGFSERERQVAALLRPHLQEVWLEAERRRAGVPQLTPR